MTLYELVNFAGGFDICDDDFDWGIYFDFSDGSNDAYDQFMITIAKQIEVIKLKQDQYSPCKVADFIVKNLDAFKKFFNEENREGYRPMDYENADNNTVDEGFFEAYMQGMESLIAGNYTDDDYKKLLKLLSN